MSAAPVPVNVNSFGDVAAMRLASKKQDPEALRAAARQFESMFTQMLLKSARDAKLGDDAMGNDQTEFYQDMFDQQMAQQMSAGKGLGIADMLIRQLQHTAAGQTQSTQAAAAAAAAKPIQAVPATAAVTAANTTASSDPVSQFIGDILPHAQKAAAELGVPPRMLAAQAALETGWGKHVMKNADGSSSYNLFGIKADASWKGARVTQATGEYVNGVQQTETAQFRSYGSLDEAFADYASFLKSNPRYAQALNQQGGAPFVNALQQAGYATDPAYAQKILAIAGSGRMQTAMASTGILDA